MLSIGRKRELIVGLSHELVPRNGPSGIRIQQDALPADCGRELLSASWERYVAFGESTGDSARLVTLRFQPDVIVQGAQEPLLAARYRSVVSTET